jgi:hypothetical protein
MAETTVETTFTTADVAYVEETFLSLEKLCASHGQDRAQVRRQIETGSLPRPSYVLDDGSEMFPADYFDFVDQAGGHERLADVFAKRFLAAGGRREELDSRWRAYMDGVFGICLREVTPETIVRKTRLVASLRQLLTNPCPNDSDWRRELRDQVDELDALEREMAPHFDRRDHHERLPTRDFLIRAARGLYQDIFYPAAPKSGFGDK